MPRVKKKRVWVISVEWTMINDVRIEADTIEEGIEIAGNSDIPMRGAEYLESSYEVNTVFTLDNPENAEKK